MRRLQTVPAAEDNQPDTRQDIRQDTEDRLAVLLPYILSSEQLTQQLFYRIGIVHEYFRDTLSALVGIGLGFPGATILNAHPKNVSDALSHLGSNYYLYVPVLIVVVSVSILKVYISRESVEKRIRLVRECDKKLTKSLYDIRLALLEKNPSKKLQAIYREVLEVVNHHSQERSYPFRLGLAPGTALEGKSLAKRLCDENENGWG